MCKQSESSKINDYYETKWDDYYSSMREKSTEIPWDVPISQACESDYLLFKDYFASSLPVVDLGCGIGTQTLFLANHYQKVIGVDVSPEAISICKKKYSFNKRITFEVLDLLNLDCTKSFYQDLGNVNIYMRGVLQQVLEEDREEFINGIRYLLGTKGTVYLVELSPTARLFFADLFKKLGYLPENLKRVITNKVTKLVGVSQENITELFPENKFQIIEVGEKTIALETEENCYEGVPATYAIIKNLS